MKIFAIKDETKQSLAYLIYYEKDKRFFIELPDSADPCKTPILLSSLAERNVTTVDPYWSKIWVQQRIVPTDRQNLGAILRDNGLESYDEFALLKLANGRCAQDDYYIEPVRESELPAELTERFGRKIDDILPLGSGEYLIFFRCGKIKRINIGMFAEKNERLAALLRAMPEQADKAQVLTGGYGLVWNNDITVMYPDIYASGADVPLKTTELILFAQQNVVNAAEAGEMLNCSRQYINELVKTKKLTPIKSSGKNTMFLKSDILKKLWE